MHLAYKYLYIKKNKKQMFSPLEHKYLGIDSLRPDERRGNLGYDFWDMICQTPVDMLGGTLLHLCIPPKVVGELHTV